MPIPERITLPPTAMGSTTVTHRRWWPRLVLWTGLGCGAAALSALATFRESHALLINASPSLPYWAIWLNRSATPARGDLILFEPPASALLQRHFGKGPMIFGKRVAGVAGDRVTRKAATFFVNGRAVAVAKPFSRSGEPLLPGPTGTLPPGCYFVATENKDSFDSRYAAIGSICGARVLGVGTPVL
ncbi:S26 family signal peptidase [Novosphingobium percolationis]|uniref:S26 family signal peptidase n=1 Tax=Novosphingobium percolationis TaxID=2871811 RepID=UPI001CD61086|nr:S26 family signal peptidase [Novosphingobium percolationis]